MADVTKTIHVRVVTFDPAKGEDVPVPNATVLVEDDGWFYNPNLSSGTDKSGADGKVTIDITFKDTEENSLNPFLTLELAEADRKLPVGAVADKQIALPDDWVTQHDVKRRIPRITEHTDPNNPLEILYGLPAALHISYTDFHPSGIRNPLALPASTTRVYLADYDTFLFLDFLNPDDTLKGFAYDPKAGKSVGIGDTDQYPYFDVWPTTPAAREGLPTTPRAWIDPPETPVGVLGGGSFVQAGQLAVDSHGFVFVIDGNAIRRFYPDGTLCETIDTTFAALNNPGGLAVDQYRNLFVADTGNDRIVIYQPNWLDGQFGVYTQTTTFGGHGAGNGKFDSPRGLVVVPNRVVDGDELLAVADTGNQRVQVLTIAVAGAPPLSRRASLSQAANLAFLAKFGVVGNGPDQFTEPIGVAADRDGRLFVCDRVLHRVSRWRPDPAGPGYLHDATWEKAGGGAGAGDGEFDTPQAIAVDLKNKYVYVAESGNNRLQRLDADSGNHLVNWTHVYAPALPNPFTPIGVAVDARGELYTGDSANQRIVRATVYDGGVTGDGPGTPLADNSPPIATPEVVGPPWTPRGEPGHLYAPAYLFLAPDGRLWVSDTGNDRVVLYARNAVDELALVTPQPTLAGLSKPVGLAVDTDGSLYVADSDSDLIRHYDAAFAHLADFGGTGSGANQFDRPLGLALVVRTEKRLYVADRNNNRVQILKLDGTFIGDLNTGGGTAFDHPEDVAVDAKGNLYVADTGNRRIVQFDNSDTFVREIKLKGHALSFHDPCGVDLDEDGKLIVADRSLGAIFRLESDGDVLAFWDLRGLVRMRTLSATKAQKKGVVALTPAVVTQSYTGVYGPEARLVTTGGGLTLTPSDGSAAIPHVLNAGDLLFVGDKDKVKVDDLLFARLEQLEYYPEQARLQRFNRPTRAVLDDKGLLIVADTDHNRLRLVRTRTNVLTNLVDLGEGLPDISFRAVMDTDRSDEIGLKVEIANVPFAAASNVLKQIPVLRVILGPITTIAFSSNDFVTEPEDDFSDDRYKGVFQLGPAKLVNGSINTLNVIYTAQRWLKHLSREDEPGHRWGDAENSQKLLIDLIRKPNSYHPWFADTLKLGTDEKGRGVDVWDDSVIVHELHHWIFDKSVRPYPPFGLDGGDHRHDAIRSKNGAITEGYAEYAELFWGAEYSSADRVRGYGMTGINSSGGRLGGVDEVDGDTVKGTFYIFGGPTSAAPSFATPNKGLEVEGYFANTLYQLQHALAEPGILFADAPTYWYAYNSFVTTEQSRRFAAILRKAMREFPSNPTSAQRKQGSELYMKQVLAAAHADPSNLTQVVQTIFELNNQLMPVLTVTEGTSSTAPGSEVASSITVQETNTKSFIVQVTDATGQPLAGYNLNFQVTSTGDWHFTPGGTGPAAEHGKLPTSGLNRATNANGIVNIVYEAPPISAGHTETLAVSYQPDFDRDATLAPPVRGDNLETTLRKLYLYELRTTAKIWDGSNNNFGARATAQTIAVKVVAP